MPFFTVLNLSSSVGMFSVVNVCKDTHVPAHSYHFQVMVTLAKKKKKPCYHFHVLVTWEEKIKHVFWLPEVLAYPMFRSQIKV